MELLKEKYREDLVRRIEETPDEEIEKAGYIKEGILQECFFRDLWACYQRDIEKFHCNPDWAYVDAMESVLGILLKNDARPSEVHHKFPVSGVQYPGEDGITASGVKDILDCAAGYYFDFIRVDGNASSATFVVQSEVYAEWEEKGVLPLFAEFVMKILDDKEKETPDGIYSFTYGEETTEVLLRYM